MLKKRFALLLMMALLGIGSGRAWAATLAISDIKAEPVIGYGGTGGNILYIGGMYGATAGKTTFTISRDPQTGNIILSWTGANPVLYFMGGNGTGQYSNTYSASVWTPVASSSDFSAVATVNGVSSITHTGANKQAEFYYKAVPAAVDSVKTQVDPKGNGKTYFETSPAVGKMDISLVAGFNFISLPYIFDTGNDALEKVFGNQLQSGGTPSSADEVYFKSDANSWGMTNAFPKSDGHWYLSAAPASLVTFAVNRAYGYLISVKNSSFTKTNPKKITTVGIVSTADQALALNPGFNAFGVVYPVAVSLDNLGLNSVTNVKSGSVPSSADEIYFKNDPTSWGMTNVFLKSDGHWYLSASPSTATTFGLSLPYGYFYSMKTPGVTINWNRRFQ